MKFKSSIPRKQISVLSLTLGLITAITSLYLIQVESQGNTESINIMTWNVHKGIGMDNKYDLDRIASIIKDQQAAIVGLQEIEEEMAADIADELNMEYFFGSDFDDDEGNTLLSKYPIEKVENIYLAPDHERSLIKAEITINSEKWYVFITHLSLRDQEDNYLQIDYILSKVLKSYSSHVVFVGDFNFGPNSDQYNRIMNNEDIKLKDTYSNLNEDSGLTFRTNFLFRRIDYIFCSLDLKPTTSEVIYNYASDHCAVITTFII
jgi:endonuclease/exonuclease/phosphatase family metal-dependent hydrolase